MVVGRKGIVELPSSVLNLKGDCFTDCDILITGDQSISRKHAIVHLNGASVSYLKSFTCSIRTSIHVQPGVVSLTDCKSKFGTTVNGKKLAASQKIELHHNDVISFGQRPATGPATAPSGFKSVDINDSAPHVLPKRIYA